MVRHVWVVSTSWSSDESAGPASKSGGRSGVRRHFRRSADRTEPPATVGEAEEVTPAPLVLQGEGGMYAEPDLPFRRDDLDP